MSIVSGDRKWIVIISIVFLCMGLCIVSHGLLEASPVWTETNGPSGMTMSLEYKESDNVLYAGVQSGDDGVWEYQSGIWNDTGGTVGEYGVRCIKYDAPHSVLYAGTIDHGVWKYQSGTWSDTGGGVSSYNVYSLALDVTNNILYAGTNGHGVWKYQSGVWGNTGGGVSSYYISELTFDATNNALYAGANNGGPQGVWKYQSGVWSNTGGGIVSSSYTRSLLFDDTNDILYAGVGNNGVWKYESGTWSETGGGVGSYACYSLELDATSSILYAGTGTDNGVWKYQSGTWSDTGGIVSSETVYSLACNTTDNVLYAGGGSQVWKYAEPGPSIEQISPSSGYRGWSGYVDITGDGTSFAQGKSAAIFSGSGITINGTTVIDATHAVADITVSSEADLTTRNVNVVTNGDVPDPLIDGFSVTDTPQPEPSNTWYLAEGSTNGGFETWVLVQNPGTEIAAVDITYMTSTGEIPGPHIDIAPKSRKTVNVSDTVPGVWDISTEVTSDKPIIAERSMYWGDRTGGHDSIGVTTPTKTWYLAEGSTNGGFETWILIQNPYEQKANVQLAYMTPTGEMNGPAAVIEPNSRKSFNVADTVANEWSVSTRVTSDIPVVAERSMYWANRIGGHDSIGIAVPAKNWYLAEGSTNGGFETWVLVQNPGDAKANVAITYMTDTGETTGPGIEIEPKSRKTVNVADTLPGVWSVSTRIESDQPVIAERAMYWGNRVGGHDSVGVTTAAETWYLAEGSTNGGFETWVLVMNPGEESASVDVTYMTDSGEVVGPHIDLAPKSRKTVNVADTLPGVWSVSTRIESDQPVIAERAMYWGNRIGGHDSIGVCEQ